MKFAKIIEQKLAGSVSVFLVLLLLPMVTLSGIVIDRARLSAVKPIISGAGDLAINGALSEYDFVLKDIYGLFVMSQTPDELTERLETYFTNSLNGGVEIPEISAQFDEIFTNVLAKDSEERSKFMNMNLLSFSATEVKGSQLTNPKVLKRQIIEYMKYHAPVNIGKEILLKFNLFKDVSTKTQDITKKIDYDKKLDDIGVNFSELSEIFKSYQSNLGGLSDGTLRSQFSNSVEKVQNLLVLAVKVKATLNLEDVHKIEVINEAKAILEEVGAYNISDESLPLISELVNQSVEQIKTWWNLCTSLEKENKQLIDNVSKILDKLEAVKNEGGNSSLQAGYSANLFFQDIESLHSFHEQLKSNSEFFKQFKKCISSVKWNDKEVHRGVELSQIANNFSGEIADLDNYSRQLVEKNLVNKLAEELPENELIVFSESMPLFKKLLKSNSDSVAKSEAKNNEKLLNSLGESRGNNLVKSEDITSGKMSTLLPVGFTYEGETQSVNFSGDKAEGLSLVGKIFAILGDGLTEIVDSVYLEEYITEMFSNYLSKQNDLTMSGARLIPENNYFFRGETEYILWGNDDVFANVDAMQTALLWTRFALNSAYAFTSPEIQETALAMATAIAGWTIFGVPLVQTTLTLAFALVESKLDLEDLMNGHDVVIYKTPSTWRCSGTGLVKGVLEKTLDEASVMVEDVFAKINSYSGEGIDNLVDSVTSYVDETTENTINSVVSAIIVPLRNVMTITINDDFGALNSTQIASRIDDIFINIRKSFTEEDDDLVTICKKEALDLLENSGIKENLVSVMTIVDRPIDKLEKLLYEELQKATDQIRTAIVTKVSEVGEAAKEEIKSITAGSEEQVKEAMEKSVENFIQKLNGDKKVAGAGSTTSGITFNYKEYLKLFIILGLMSESMQTNMLERISHVIQVNMTHGKNEDVISKPFLKNTNFDLSKQPTIVRIQAKIGVPSIFFNNSTKMLGYKTLTMKFNGVGGY